MAKRFTPTPLSDEQRAQRRREEQELTEHAVAQLRSSAGWQRWLAARSQAGLRRLSVGNQLLCALQAPDAEYVAGFRGWLRLGYVVQKGSKSIRIWAPCPPSKKKLQAWRDAGSNPREAPKTFFRLEAVFTQAQVAPLPPPAEPAPLGPQVSEITGDSLAWALKPLEQVAHELGYSVVYQHLAKGHGGSCNHRTSVITINNQAALNAQVSVACHELAHALTRVDRREDDPDLDYAAGELVAESVSHLLVSFLGLASASSASAIPYLASWAESADPQTFQRIAELVDRLARRLEDVLADEDPGSTAAEPPADTDLVYAAGAGESTAFVS